MAFSRSWKNVHAVSLLFTQKYVVNEMHHELFRVKGRHVESEQLPPPARTVSTCCKGQLQAAIRHCPLQADPKVPSPLDCKGWSLGDDGELQINWMTGAPAPNIVLDFLSCKCKKLCKLPSCQCMVNGLSCTQACTLQDCKNMKDDDVGAMQEEGSDIDSYSGIQ